MNFYLGWNKTINRKFKSNYKFMLVFDRVSFYPVTALLKLYLIKSDEKIEVNSVNVFKGRITIEDEEQALDFVRLFTEPELHVFFDLLAIEVFKKSSNPFEPYGSIPDNVFGDLGLVEATVEKKDSLFVVNRTLFFYPDSEGIVGKRIAVVKEFVKNDGEYSIEILREINYEKIDEIETPIG
ncbi:MAG: hypothetical protein N2169_00950 [bacterium]|nr:hypothetical protein [bacterium]